IIELPRLFHYADNETVALMASGRREKGTHVSVRYAEVRPQDAELFLKDFKVAAARSKTITVGDAAKSFTLWIPPRGSLFERFTEMPKLGELTTIRQGLHWKGRTDGKPRTAPRTDVATDTLKAGFHHGAEKMAGNLTQFRISEFRYLSLLPEHQSPRDKAWKLPWGQRKVVCNAARFERKSPC